MVVVCSDENNVVCKSEVGEVRVGKSHSMVTSHPLSCWSFHDIAGVT